MSVRSAIPAVEGVQDRQVALILGAMKAIIEKATGRTPNSPQIKTLGPNATVGALVTKINEVINRLQDAVATGAATATPESQDPSAAKFWVYFTGVTNTSILASYNVASLIDNGTGDTTINFVKPFTSANYAVEATSRLTGAANVWGQVENYTASSLRYMSIKSDGSFLDCDVNNCVGFGAQS